jgi:hypothetical protein
VERGLIGDDMATIVSLAKETKLPLEIVRITPEMASRFLELNTLNRPLSDVHVQRIAKQIKDGKWRFNGDTIKIADTNDVLDGQHRLWAIIEARKPIETVIVRGIKRDAFATIDTVRRMRSGGDVLALAGAQRYRNVAASALCWMLRWQRDVLTDYRAPKNKIENSDIEAAFDAHPRIVNAAERAMKLRGLANASVMTFVFYVLSNRDMELAERMMATLENPAGVALNDPFFRLRTYFTLDHHRPKDPIMTIALSFKAINAAAKGKSVEKLMWRNQGSKPEDFPFLDV